MRYLISLILGLVVVFSIKVEVVKGDEGRCLLSDQKVIKTLEKGLICRNYKKDLILYKYDKGRLVNTVTLFPQRGEYLIYISKSSSERGDSLHTAFFVDEKTRKLTRWINEGNTLPNFDLIKEFSSDITLLIDTEKANGYQPEQF